MSHPVDEFLARTPLHAVLALPHSVVEQAMSAAYGCYCSGRYDDAEVLCKGILAVDPTGWWPYSLYAATLRALGRPREALAVIHAGLQRAPGQAKLLAMREAILAAARQAAAPESSETREAA
jgi:thioredoxin-like negative regulator of GroEL